MKDDDEKGRDLISDLLDAMLHPENWDVPGLLGDAASCIASLEAKIEEMEQEAVSSAQ